MLPIGDTAVRGGRVSFLESKDLVELGEEGRDDVDGGGSGPTVLVDAQSPIAKRVAGYVLVSRRAQEGETVKKKIFFP